MKKCSIRLILLALSGSLSLCACARRIERRFQLQLDKSHQLVDFQATAQGEIHYSYLADGTLHYSHGRSPLPQQHRPVRPVSGDDRLTLDDGRSITIEEGILYVDGKLLRRDIDAVQPQSLNYQPRQELSFVRRTDEGSFIYTLNVDQLEVQTIIGPYDAMIGKRYSSDGQHVFAAYERGEPDREFLYINGRRVGPFDETIIWGFNQRQHLFYFGRLARRYFFYDGRPVNDRSGESRNPFGPMNSIGNIRFFGPGGEPVFTYDSDRGLYLFYDYMIIGPHDRLENVFWGGMNRPLLLERSIDSSELWLRIDSRAYGPFNIVEEEYIDADLTLLRVETDEGEDTRLILHDDDTLYRGRLIRGSEGRAIAALYYEAEHHRLIWQPSGS